MAELVYKTGYLHVDHEMQALAELLAAVFGIDINLLRTYGGHDPSLTPFSYFDRSGVCVASVNVFTMPMMWNGSVIKAYGLQSVAVLPNWRGKGLFQELFSRAVDDCDKGAGAPQLLYTETPALYEAWGFQAVPEMMSCVAVSRKRNVVSRGKIAGRLLDIHCSADFALLQNLLARREAVSLNFAVCHHAPMFFFNLLHDENKKCLYMQALEMVIVYTQEKERVVIDDLVSPSIPSWADIVASLPVEAEMISLHFPADRFDIQTMAKPLARDMALMVRLPQGCSLPEQICLPDMASF